MAKHCNLFKVKSLPMCLQVRYMPKGMRLVGNSQNIFGNIP